jgi:predicted transcriptional regulator of viral defense system
MNSFDFEVFLADHPTFSLRQLAAARGDEESQDAARNQLKHHLSTGRIKAVTRGVYALVPPGIDAQRYLPDTFLVAQAARPKGVFSYHSALELLGEAHSVWHECTLHCDRRREPIEVGPTRILFLATPKPLARRKLQMIGIRSVAHQVRHLVTTGPERTLVEGFRRPHRVGGLEELLESTRGFSMMDFDILRQVLEAYDERTLWAAVGWLAERDREQWSTPEGFLDLCRQQGLRQNQYLVRGLRGGRLISGWKLIVPETLLTAADDHAANR